jgi:hypothetical protein
MPRGMSRGRPRWNVLKDALGNYQRGTPGQLGWGCLLTNKPCLDQSHHSSLRLTAKFSLQPARESALHGQPQLRRQRVEECAVLFKKNVTYRYYFRFAQASVKSRTAYRIFNAYKLRGWYIISRVILRCGCEV